MPFDVDNSFARCGLDRDRTPDLEGVGRDLCDRTRAQIDADLDDWFATQSIIREYDGALV